MKRQIATAALAALALAAACGDTTYGFDDVTVGEDDGARQPQERSNSQFVRAVYGDLVGRAPESYEFVVSADGDELFRFPVDEQSQLVDSLEGMGDSRPLRALLTAGLVSSAEVRLPERAEVEDPAAFISDQFRRLLGREPTAYELRAFVDEWQADEAVGPRTVVRALIGSREYQSF
jgi:hypothetical protein